MLSEYVIMLYIKLYINLKRFCMHTNIKFEKFLLTDLNMYLCGTEECESLHYYGPARRDHYLIHYIHSGKGIFRIDSREYTLTKGQGFLICPDVVSFYQADKHDPWHYSWVGFNGIKAKDYLNQTNLNFDNPIFTYTKDEYLKECLDEMVAAKNIKTGRDFIYLSLLYKFLYKLVEISDSPTTISGNINKKDEYYHKAVEFISMNYSSKITITDLASYIGIDRSYLYSIFKEQIDVSPQEFLINCRVNRACELMTNHELSIGDISRSVGYEDQLNFSRIFKQIKGSSPKEYRNNLIKPKFETGSC